MENKNNLIISGNGKGNRAVIFMWLRYVPLVILGIVLIVFSTEIENLLYISRAFGLFLGLLIVIGGALETIIKHICITKTQINVYENSIAGRGVSKSFNFGAYTTKNFKLMYNQITSLESVKSSIVVHSSGTQYRVYVPNPDEIKNTIFKLKQGETSQ